MAKVDDLLKEVLEHLESHGGRDLPITVKVREHLGPKPAEPTKAEPHK